MAADKEVWQNNGLGEIWINVTDHRGQLTQSVVRPGSKIFITTNDRIINQEIAANEDLDIFKNGMLTPVKILEDAEDYAEIASNPNHLSEEDMKSLFKLKIADFKSRLEDISNPITISRIHDLAENADETGLNVTVTQLKNVKRRYAEVTGAIEAGDRTQTPIQKDLESI